MDFDISAEAVLIVLRRHAATDPLLAAKVTAAMWEAVAEQEHKARVEAEEEGT
jgi:hypothetical protein